MCFWCDREISSFHTRIHFSLSPSLRDFSDPNPRKRKSANKTVCFSSQYFRCICRYRRANIVYFKYRHHNPFVAPEPDDRGAHSRDRVENESAKCAGRRRNAELLAQQTIKCSDLLLEFRWPRSFAFAAAESER